jgi:hypothetical protein
MSPARNPDSFSLDAEVQRPLPPEGTAAARPVRKRTGFFVPIDPSTGGIDMSRARPDQVELLRQSLGAKDDKKEEVRPKADISPALIKSAYSLLELLIQTGGKMLLKWPKELASEMYFSPEKKEELIEPTKALADKYAPVWLVENSDLAALGMTLSSAVNDMVNHATERYMIKVMSGQAPPPPGIRISTARPSPQPASPPPPPTPSTPAVEVHSPVNGGGMPVIQKTGPLAPGFVPLPPTGIV